MAPAIRIGLGPFLLELRKSQPRIAFARIFRWSGQKEAPMPTELRAKKAPPEWSWQAKARIDPDLIAIAQFCAIGLLVTLIVMLSFPGLGALLEQYNQF
jgi:hypothetical protein